MCTKLMPILEIKTVSKKMLVIYPECECFTAFSMQSVKILIVLDTLSMSF